MYFINYLGTDQGDFTHLNPTHQTPASPTIEGFQGINTYT